MITTAITVTQDAKNYINERLSDNRLLLIKLNTKGCSGNSIDYDLIDTKNVGKYDEVILWEDGGLVIESSSIMGLLGSTLDVNSSIVESYLTWKNPNATNHCGCGSSFELIDCKST